MDELIKRRIKEVASYIIETHSTLRDTAEHFNISKSTIHKDIKHRLMDVDFQMYKDVINIISENKMERHIRGGMQTKLNFSKNKIKGEDEQMELTKREQQIINSVKDLRSKEVALCTRQEIINNINIIERFVNYNNAFEKLEVKGHLTTSKTNDSVYVINKSQIDGFKSINEVKLINNHIGQGIKFLDIMNFTGIEKTLIYRFMNKINKDNKFHLKENNYLCLTLQGFKEVYLYLDKSGEITQNQKELLIQLGNYMDNTFNLDREDDTYEDLDEIFESLLKTVDNIGTKISTFKSVRESKEEQIHILEQDKNFYKSKCDEYRRNVIRLQEKIDSLRWG